MRVLTNENSYKVLEGQSFCKGQADRQTDNVILIYLPPYPNYITEGGGGGGGGGFHHATTGVVLPTCLELGGW